MYEARAAHARAAKQARLEESQQFSLSISTSTVAVESQQDSREEIVTDWSVEHEGEMSGAGEPESSDSEGMGSESSDEESDFNDQKAQDIFDDWVTSLPVFQRKTLAVLLFHSFRVRQQMSITGAAQESASITGYNEKTVRMYHKEFYDNKGQFTETKQGKYKRNNLINDEDLRLDAAMYVREHAYQKGAANMTAKSFCQWVNTDLLPSHTLAPQLPRSISVRTATRWLHQLGFRPHHCRAFPV